MASPFVFQIGSPNSRAQAPPSPLHPARPLGAAGDGEQAEDGGAPVQEAAAQQPGELEDTTNAHEDEPLGTAAEPLGTAAGAKEDEEDAAPPGADRDFCWVFTARRKRDFDSPGEHQLMSLSLEDVHYAESSYRTQRIALRFTHTLDPLLLTQALHLAITEYPRVGSRLVVHHDEPKFHLEAGEITVRLVAVAPEVLSSGGAAWDNACQSMSPQKRVGFGPDATQLFEACLLTSHDAEAGCVLVAGFQHVLGDATSYALFMHKWSTIYHARAGHKLRELFPAAGDHEDAGKAPGAGLPRPDIPKDAFSPPLSAKRSSGSPEKDQSRRLFALSTQQLLSLKESMLAGGAKYDGRICSTNDILMAQCACAMAPSRLVALREAAGLVASRSSADVSTDAIKDPINSTARIVVLADHRGRGLGAGVWGNHSVDLSILLSYRLLLSGDVPAVARAISGALRYEMHKLEHDLVLYNFEKRQNADKAKLFLWNSWGRMGYRLSDARFGGDEHALLDIQWLNMASLEAGDRSAIVTVSPWSTKGISIAVAIDAASRDDEFKELSASWLCASDVKATGDQRGGGGGDR